MAGYAGESSGRIRYGQNPTGTVVAISGALADELAVEALSYAHNCSRIDLAVTTRHTPGDLQLAKRLAAEYDGWRAHSRKPPTPTLIDGRGLGDTLYLGRRTSDRYVRLYNKGLESKSAQYLDCWRLECEYKGVTAASVAAAAAGAADRLAWVAAELRVWLLSHGLHPWWPDSCDRVSNRSFHRRADADSRLAWIDAQVMPSLRWLVGDGLLSPELLETVQGQLDHAKAVREAERLADLRSTDGLGDST